MSFGGNKNAAYNRNLRNFMKDVPDAEFERYVDTRGDLANAWRMIDTYQKGGDMSGFADHNGMSPAAQAQYWIKKAEGGRFNKADFGRFHAGEDKALLEGNYPGGTKIVKGSPAYDKYFPDKSTRFEQLEEGAGESAPVSTPSRSRPGGNIKQVVKAYAPPDAKDWSAYNPIRAFGSNRLFSPHANLAEKGLMNYQPWAKQALEGRVPAGLIGFTPTKLKSWTLPATQWVDWADYKDLETFNPYESEEPEEPENPGPP